MSINEKELNQKNEGVKTKVIDCDIHEMLKSVKQLFPYLKEPYKKWIKYGWRPGGLRYAHPIGGLRLDSYPDKGLPGSDYELVKRQVLDEYNVEYAILTGLFYPSQLDCQRELASALASAYNDWVIDEWLSKDSRFKASIQITGQDVPASVREIDRLGPHPDMVQVMLPVSAWRWGEPQFHPIFEAAERHNLRIAFHQSDKTSPAYGHPNYYIEWHSMFTQAFMAQVGSLIFNGVFDKYPGIKVIMLEGGFTWVPHVMWRMDQNYKSLRSEVPWVKRMPSDYIRDHFVFSTQPIEDPNPKYLKQIVDMMESDQMLVFATDYAHWDFDSPTRSLPTSFSKEFKQKVLYDNAKRFYGFD
ncbi:amidohydrolase family protein [Alkalihalobacterium sp. APHAB7]|uniref:amidohydrolase family protein n=1 Tax=Alkalihalobacterium sp. APHAB7 TaxID=3402081 RepID=UPI003AACF77D